MANLFIITLALLSTHSLQVLSQDKPSFGQQVQQDSDATIVRRVTSLSQSSELKLSSILGAKSEVKQQQSSIPSSPRSRGQNCRTTFNKAGRCSYITDPECQRLHDKLVSRKKIRSTLRAIRNAIKAPCGWDGDDLTMCCPKDCSGNCDNNNGGSQSGQCGVKFSQGGGIVPDVGGITFSKREAQEPFIKIPLPDDDHRPAVVGGFTSEPGAWPWAVVLGRPEGTGFKPVCGGTLISDRYVLTAAHCFPNNPSPSEVISRARVGEHNVNSDFDGANPQDFEICDTKIHSRYSTLNGVQNDIALIKLCSPVTFNGFVQPACLPARNEVNLPNTLTVVGWGSEYNGGSTVQELKEAEVDLVPFSECEEQYSLLNSVSLSEKQICAGRGSTDTCAGDSGGPLMVERNGRWTVVGITSFGVGCGNKVFPGVYTNVVKYLGWIQRRMN